MAANYQRRSSGGMNADGLPAFKKFLTGLRTSYPDMKVVLDESSRRPTQHARLTKRVFELEEQLSAARKNKERVKTLAELTKAGYVYVLSNIGSFGEHVYKIGMTRRLDPMDRVRELGVRQCHSGSTCISGRRRGRHLGHSAICGN